MPAPPFSEFVLITIAAWAVGAVVFFGGRWVRWEAPRRAANVTFYCALGLFTITFAWLGILRHEAFNSHSYDLAIYDQLVWNISHGRPFQSSLEYYVYNFLGDHLSLSLVFLAPLYWIYSSPLVLIALQPLAIALAGLPVYWWAREKLSPGGALAVGLSYLVFTPSIYVIAIDFHDIVLAAPLLSFATYFMIKGDVRRFSMFAFPALLVKEEVGLLVAVLGLYWLLGRKRYVFGAGTAALGIAWAVIAMLVIIPAFNPDGHYYYLGRETSLGVSQEAFLLSFLVRPAQAAAQVFTPEKIRYVLHLLTPLGFIPLLAPGLLALALPTLGYLLLRGESPQFLIITQYAAPIVPFLFYATIRGLSRARSQRLAAALPVVLMVASGASYYFQSPGPLSENFAPQRYTVSSRAQAAEDLIASIPPDAGVVAQSDLVPHLSERQRIYMFPEVPTLDGIDYVLFDPQGNRYPLGNSDEAYERAVAEVTSNPDFRQVMEKQGYLLLERTDDKPVPQVAVLGGKVKLYGYAIEKSDSQVETPGGRTVAYGDTSGTETDQPESLTISLYWEALAPMEEDYSLFVHVVDSQGRHVAQWDGPPLGKLLPTSRWKSGVRLRGTYTLPMPAGLAMQNYHLEVGLYNWQTLDRLPVTDATGSSLGDSIVILPAGTGRLAR